MESKIEKLKCANCKNEEKQFAFSQLTKSKKAYEAFFIVIWILSLGSMAICVTISLSLTIKETEKIIIAGLTLLKFFITNISIFGISMIVRILQPYKIFSCSIAICPICGYSWTLSETKERFF